MLSVAGSMQTGKVGTYDLLRMMTSRDRMIGRWDGFAHYGRVFKTLHLRQFIDSEAYRRTIGARLNIGAGRHVGMSMEPPLPVSPPLERLEVHSRNHVLGLDGLRGLAALYVLLFHCWLLTFPGFPDNSGPSWLGWLMYGRLAVVFFLVLSGFSLAISPARNGWQLGGGVRFLRRRAWRILPPYWAALVLSLMVAWFVVPASHLGPPSDKSILVYGLVVQDIFMAPTPNGAFWSIGVEAELYLVFPFLLLIRRRLGAVILVAGVTSLVVARGLLAANASPVEGVNWLTPNLAPVFVAGLVGAGVIVASEKVRRLPWHWLAALAAVPVLSLVAIKGSVWTVDHYFWVDLAVVPAMTMLLAAVATGRPAFLMWLLATRPIRSLGNFSYSLYLIHLPIVMIVGRKIAPQYVSPGLPAFWFTVMLGLPASVLGARLFAKIFEMPFQRNRSWKSLFSAGRSRWKGLDAARAHGVRIGRPPTMTEEQVRHARDLLARPESTVTSIAELLGVSRTTIYHHVPELQGGRLALAETTNAAELPRPAKAKD
ncbi:acyltransferase family protein [Streptomyces sp. NPDC001530]|uniref:acyltransferase family protein n=1 Tax=Streptomyces sp. NPDC001530 TaxID=3364582 RepID=UPI00368F3C7F